MINQTPGNFGLSDKNSGDTGVKFEDSGWKKEHFQKPATPHIVLLVMKYSGGLVKNEKQASYAVGGIILIIVIISLTLFLGTTQTRNRFYRDSTIPPPMIPGENFNSQPPPF